MKSPDDIKKGLELCGMLDGDCDNCPYDNAKIYCGDRLQKDALAYITQLEQRLAQVERENDALLDDLRHTFDPCCVCKKQDICEQHCPSNDYNCPECKDKHRCICHNCTADNDLWEWRGVCEENSKEGNE